MTLQMHVDFLRRQIVKLQPKTMIILLNSLFKKLLQNEGIMEQDDSFRDEHTEKRKKITKMLKEIPEVQEAT